MNERTCLILVGVCIAKMVFIFLDQGLIPVGVNQYPNQSVSLTAYSHLAGLTVKLFCSK